MEVKRTQLVMYLRHYRALVDETNLEKNLLTRAAQLQMIVQAICNGGPEVSYTIIPFIQSLEYPRRQSVGGKSPYEMEGLPRSSPRSNGKYEQKLDWAVPWQG